MGQPKADRRTNKLVLPLILSLLFSATAAKAVIIIIKRVGNKTVSCMHTGLSSSLKDCGIRPDWYSYVFLGSISAITSVENDENELKIIPEEVFGGKPAPLLTVMTSQAACLPKLSVGDRWLFFLRDEPGKPIVLDYYGNDSLPVASGQQQIETLRRLRAIVDSGLLQGTVWRLTSSGAEAVIGATVIARRLTDGQPYVAMTGTDGRYDFQPLPPATYKITVEPVGAFRPNDSQVDLSRGSCWDVTLSRSPHAQLSGHVRRSDGSPVAKASIILTDADNSRSQMTQTDENGYFYFGSLEAGTYFAGMNPPETPGAVLGAGAGVKIPAASVYYPDSKERSGAVAIELAPDEKRDSIDFVARTP